MKRSPTMLALAGCLTLTWAGSVQEGEMREALRMLGLARRLQWSLALFAAAVVVLLLPGAALATTPSVTGGLSVRVTPDVQVEFKWTTNVAWYGSVKVYEQNGLSLGALVLSKQDLDSVGNPVASTLHDVTVGVGSGSDQLAPDHAYFWVVSATDPNNPGSEIVLPGIQKVFTGAQTISNLSVVAVANSAEISWDASVPGLGRVTISPAGVDGKTTFDDTNNTTSHDFLISDFQAGTTYTFTVSNRHAIDGDNLASQSGVFTTDATFCFCIKSQSVRVIPEQSVQFEWKFDLVWYGKIEIFTTPDGTGTPIAAFRDVDEAGTPIASIHHKIMRPVALPLTPDTTFYFRITMTDPTGTLGDTVTPTPLPPFFTGAQELTNVTAESITSSSATIAWQANVIGFGKVVYGTTSLNQGPVEDAFNITDHAIDLTGLQPATTYQFMASNNHAIDGDALASATGQFTTHVSKCTSKEFAAAGKKVGAKAKCYAKAVAKNDRSTLSGCLGTADTKFAAAYGKATPAGDCLTNASATAVESEVDGLISDLNTTLTGGSSGPSKCTSKELSAAGGKAGGKAKCYAKAAAKNNTSTLSTCLADADLKFSTAYGKAMVAGGCINTTTAGAVESKVDGFVTNLRSSLTCPVNTVACASVCANIATDSNNCGACGDVCALPNTSTDTCVGGTCEIGTCTAGFANCDQNPANGCEVNLNTDGNNCGRCGRVCPALFPLCVGGNCL